MTSCSLTEHMIDEDIIRSHTTWFYVDLIHAEINIVTIADR